MNFSLGSLIDMLFSVPVLLIAFPVHELSHAYTAYKLGDPTAKNMGRLSLNPFKHLDLFGTICLILFRFGWAKPVPINPYNFKNPRAGMALTSLAGPVSNLILGFISLFLEGLYQITLISSAPYIVSYIIVNFLFMSTYINIGLCLFNLIPIPPLDGEKILAFFLPERLEEFFDRYSRVFGIIVLLLLFTPVITNPLNHMVINVYNNFTMAVNFVFKSFTGNSQVISYISQ